MNNPASSAKGAGMQELHERNPVRAMAQHMGGALLPGEVAFITARPGVGKSALLVHAALEQLLNDHNVLHVALDETVDHVRTHYDQVFRASSNRGGSAERTTAMVAAERHRMILTYYGRSFTVEHLEQNLDMLADTAGFKPKCMVVDGVNANDMDRVMPGLARIARERSVSLWFTGRELAAGTDAPLWGHVRVGLRLTPESTSIRVTRLDRDGSAHDLDVQLDPTTMLSLDKVGGTSDGASTLRAVDCTLYSGGANGSELAFGQAAERWEVNETNFTFDGHRQVRDQGRYLLSPRELAAGDVSLVYVSRRLNRTYSEGTLIRKVLQTLWHMVSRSQQVFVVGQIQEDGTVVGGTGWSVELARMWNKRLWVFDQDQSRWFRWDGEGWVAGRPVIDSIHFTGTGTRYLQDNGRAAIDELFERSFAQQD
ncbi:MAG: hypothetical protein ACI9MC_002307 [Kiritimatiellia bacterium]|jgi:hypothetical protein